MGAQLSISPRMVALWRERFLARGIEGLLKDAPRPGRTPSIAETVIEEVIRKTTQTTPANATHWSTRLMASRSGHLGGQRAAHLARAWTQAASRGQLQSQPRSGVRGQARRYRRHTRSGHAQ
jgi:hypothetical protein